jgi:hypothetical protein
MQARVIETNLQPVPLLNLNSGYITRATKTLPSQGNKAPWRMYQNYILDYKMLRLILKQRINFLAIKNNHYQTVQANKENEPN